MDLCRIAPIINLIIGIFGGSTLRGSADFNKNNLDFLRLILASIVALFHLSALTDLAAFSFLSIYLSPRFAVNSFFVISGLLIYRSYTRSSSIRSYMEKRIRRIYPAYFTIVTLAAIALWPLSTLSFSQYFGAGFWKYLCSNLLFLNFLAPTLPGVFTANSMPAVNGALWTLKIEVAFYLLIPFIFYLSRRFGAKRIVALIFCFSVIWKYGFAFLASRGAAPALYTLDSSRNIYSQMEVQFPGQLFYFCAGIMILLYFDNFKHHFLKIGILTLCLFLLDRWVTGGILEVFWISGLVFVFGFWRYFGNFAKYGDFSYGVYIVHFPVLQTLIALGLARINPLLFFVVSVLLIALAGLLMWHLIENRFLTTSSHYRQESLKSHL